MNSKSSLCGLSPAVTGETRRVRRLFLEDLNKQSVDAKQCVLMHGFLCLCLVEIYSYAYWRQTPMLSVFVWFYLLCLHVWAKTQSKVFNAYVNIIRLFRKNVLKIHVKVEIRCKLSVLEMCLLSLSSSEASFFLESAPSEIPNPKSCQFSSCVLRERASLVCVEKTH